MQTIDFYAIYRIANLNISLAKVVPNYDKNEINAEVCALNANFVNPLEITALRIYYV